jgi:hypothetical protein
MDPPHHARIKINATDMELTGDSLILLITIVQNGQQEMAVVIARMRMGT